MMMNSEARKRAQAVVNKCDCMTEDLRDGFGERVVTHSLRCPLHPEHDPDIPARLEYLRGEIRAERISYGELIELQGLAEFIDPSDVELLEWAGVPEFPERRRYQVEVLIEVELDNADEEAAYDFVANLMRAAHEEARAGRNHPGWDYEMLEGCVGEMEDFS